MPNNAIFIKFFAGTAWFSGIYILTPLSGLVNTGFNIEVPSPALKSALLLDENAKNGIALPAYYWHSYARYLYTEESYAI